MQDPSADTEWNDALRKFDILPPKPSAPENEATITEADVIKLVEDTINQKTTTKAFEDMTLEELDACEDEEDERILLEYRRKRIQQIRSEQEKSKFGELREITGVDYINEVTKAGDGVWVVLHLYQHGVQQCNLLNRHLSVLAAKFPKTKFLKSISTLCISNYPDRNMPTIFLYFEGVMKKQMVGPSSCGGVNATVEEVEWLLHEAGAIVSDLEEPPKKEIKDVLFSSLNGSAQNDEHDDNDW
ncbi:hypothetical protein CHUAL_001403 [Chamberlinius hualienensis]